MIRTFRSLVLASLSFTALAQNRGPAPSLEIIDGSPAIAGRVNPVIIQVQNVQSGFRISLVVGGRTTLVNSIGSVSPGRYSLAVPLPAGPQPYSVSLVIANPNGLSGTTSLDVVPPLAPRLQSVAPLRVAAGQLTTLSVGGVNFQKGIRVFLGQIEQQNVILVPGGLTVEVNPPPGATMPYIAPVTLINPCGLRASPCGYRASANIEVDAAQPAITAVEGEITAGFDSTLSIKGSNFQRGLRVFVNTPTQPYSDVTNKANAVGPDQLTVSLKMPTTPAPPYKAHVMVMNQNAARPQAGPSASGEFEVLAPRLQPNITNIDPLSVTAGQPAKLTVTGSNFQTNLQVFISVDGNETELTKYASVVSDSKLTVDVTMSADHATPYTAQLRISNPGGLDTSREFTVQHN